MEQNKNQNQTQTSLGHSPFTEPIHCIVKLGGAAITCKNELEMINEEILQKVSEQLRQAMISSSEKPPGMDWSKRPGDSETFCNPEEFGDHSVMECSRFIVVHGAGSFGHFQASKSAVHKGQLNKPLVKGGFVATRISVTSLNLEVVRALAREGIPSIGMSPFSCGWFTSERHISSADLSSVAKAIDSGFTPVLHGDAILDEILLVCFQGCTILSGDVIISHLATYSKPKYVVFLTDVYGVYDRPPTEPDAILLKEIAVAEDGSWSVVKPKLQNSIDLTLAAHDTTGGMKTKISEAAIIAKLGIDVYIVKAATSHSLRALNGDLRSSIPDDWLGTVVRSLR
ncbi:isopentenyl phosphate kinase isoform X2 [Gastrolobium bilobum]|uniref:isopentenyl phosphate kinase isoform X2 n=1 Tax=Gastrolobium bilobum TaxID=150636 RepID=UPI002AB248B7|nr:isopentenyl phosphate kinase isoform X2 [Gastrolobium bilobum]